MAYQSLYRRYRPQRFDEVVGQHHVTGALRNAVRDERVGHAYLFSGPRGTGKTSTARILAKALNCTAVEDGEPCGVCDSCLAIASGSSIDVHELDAASNNGVDAMRDLVARSALGTAGRWKVYIVDEVHMLSAAASNALLKTLEEPPGHVVFVLATTDPQKVLPTVRSRTQHYEFRLLPADLLSGLLRRVADDAGLQVPPEAIDVVARRGSGSARDALSALDQVAAAGGVEEEESSVDALVEALADRDAGRALVALAEACAAGRDPRQVAREVVDHLRDAFLTQMSRRLVARPDEEVARLEDQARRLGNPALVRGIEVIGEALVAMRDSVDPRITLEAALARLAHPEADVSPAALLERLERLERAARSGTDPRSVAISVAPATENATETGGEGAKPADRARAALGSSGRAAPPAPPSRPTRAPSPPPAAPKAEAAEAPAPSAPAERAGPMPSRDDLVLAWPEVYPRFQGGRSLYSAGRFLDVTGEAAVFALPNEIHRQRCEEARPRAEAALASHFGRTVPLRLVVDPGPAAPPGAAPAPPDEPIDPTELRDAHGAVTSIDHLTQAFPGAELVEE